MRGTEAVRAQLASLALLLAGGCALLTSSAVAAPSATVQPTLSGVARDGQRLRAERGTWEGRKPIGYAYSWARCDASGGGCEAIATAVRRQYKIGHADVGHALRVTVTADDGESTSATSTPSEPVLAAAPAKRTRPKLTGTAVDGQLLSVGAGAWKGTPPQSFAYQWQSCAKSAPCTDIPGATATSYRASSSQIGEKLRAVITAQNAAGSASAASAASRPVVAGQPVELSLPAVSGTLREGQTLDASTGEWAGTGPISYSYQWLRCSPLGGSCAEIAGATSASYTAGLADLASNLAVVVTASSAHGTASATSPETQAVLGILPTNTLLPSISGLLQDGGLLSGTSGEWSGSQPISHAYQWELCNSLGASCSDVSEAVASTLKLSPADVGSTVRLAVTATNAAGSTTATSPASGLVAALLPSNTALPTIGGLLELGKQLTASTGSWSGTAPIAFGYQWQLCNPLGGGCVNIAKATSSMFALVALDIGGTLRVVVTGTNAAGSVPVTSAATGLIEGLL